jgi:hypothetical protein
MSKATVQSIMETGFTEYESKHHLPRHVRNAAQSIISCRTATLGGHVQRCPKGHFQRHWYNSCKHRICPQCAFIQVDRWLAKWKARLLSCDHYHSIFTVPHELNELFLLNIKPMTDILFKTVHDTVAQLLSDQKFLGARPGIIATLHTWTQTMLLHPHIHCLITGGGMDKDGQWREVKNGYLLPARVVMQKFRGKLLAVIDAAIVREELILPAEMNYQRWVNLKNRLGRVKWNVSIRKRYSYGSGVLTYLARYLRGGCISNKRIITCIGDTVKLSYRVNGEDSDGNKKETTSLPIEQFIQRLLLHVPMPRTKAVRFYGLYSPGKKDDLNHCRKQFNQEPVEEPEFIEWQSYCNTRGSDHPELCPVCGARMIEGHKIPRHRRQYLKAFDFGKAA